MYFLHSGIADITFYIPSRKLMTGKLYKFAFANIPIFVLQDIRFAYINVIIQY